MSSDAFTEAYPLRWPEGRPRTRFRNTSKFKTGFAKARDEIVRNVKLMVGRSDLTRCGFVISTNVALRRDGLPLAGQRQPDDPGAAVYFERNKKSLCFACDRWTKVEDNLFAIAKTLEAMRGIDRWGTSEMVNAAFDGFIAIPAPEPWHKVLHVAPDATPDTINYVYRELAKKFHPDRGGNAATMAKLTAARDEGLRAAGARP